MMTKLATAMVIVVVIVFAFVIMAIIRRLIAVLVPWIIMVHIVNV